MATAGPHHAKGRLLPAVHTLDNESDERTSLGASLGDKDQVQDDRYLRARRPRSRLHTLRLFAALCDILLAATALAFLIYACLIFRYRGQPADHPMSRTLLKLSGYVWLSIPDVR